MKISKKTDYALRTLFTLVGNYSQEPISISELAESNQVPKRFLEHIMLDMKSQGWVSSTMGKQGGYVLAKDPKDITVGEVVRYFDGVLAPIGCVSVRHYEACTQEPICRFRRLFLDVRNYAAKIMDNTSLATAFLGKPVSKDEVLVCELVDGAGI